MPREPTGRPRGRPPTKGYSRPLERVTERRRRNSKSDEERQLQLRKDRDAQRNRRRDRFIEVQRQQLPLGYGLLPVEKEENIQPEDVPDHWDVSQIAEEIPEMTNKDNFEFKKIEEISAIADETDSMQNDNS